MNISYPGVLTGAYTPGYGSYMSTSAVAVSAPVNAPNMLERKFKSQANGRTVTERLYSCDNGLALGARRGGPLHLADANSWEIFTLAGGVVYGEPVGWVTDDELGNAAAALATWGGAAR